MGAATGRARTPGRTRRVPRPLRGILSASAQLLPFLRLSDLRRRGSKSNGVVDRLSVEGAVPGRRQLRRLGLLHRPQRGTGRVAAPGTRPPGRARERGDPRRRPLRRNAEHGPAGPETSRRRAGEAAGGHARLPAAARAEGALVQGDRPAAVARRADREGADLERPAAPEAPAGGGGAAMTERPEMPEMPAMSEGIPLRPSGPHPTPAEVYGARTNPAGPGAERVLRHAAACARCSEEMARQEAFDHPEPLPAAALDAAWERFGRGEPNAQSTRSMRSMRSMRT